MLVWTGEAALAASPEPVQAPVPLAYTPPYLAEKILTSRSALEGRTQTGHGAVCRSQRLHLS